MDQTLGTRKEKASARMSFSHSSRAEIPFETPEKLAHTGSNGQSLPGADMIFSSFLNASLRLLRAPAAEYALWRDRSRFRAGLAHLMQDPHLVKDLGFRPDAVVAEMRRSPWEPILLRRAAPPAVSAVETPALSPLEAFSPAPAARP